MSSISRQTSAVRPSSSYLWRRWTILLSLAGLTLGGGCRATPSSRSAGRWLMDFDTAERQVAEMGGPLLIVYRDDRHATDDDAIGDALETEPLASATRDYVRCMLFRSYEPDRRYVAQYGVLRAPALIVVHPDGTYHAQSGAILPEQGAEFLNRAQPPGARPDLNPHIVRQTRYRWLESLDRAEATATENGRPMLIVFHRRLSGDWERMSELLAPHEVYSRLSGMVPVRVALHGLFTDAYITRFGALKLPAVAIAHPDGPYHVLEMPSSSEAVVRFADEALRSDALDTAHTASAASTASHTR